MSGLVPSGQRIVELLDASVGQEDMELLRAFEDEIDVIEENAPGTLLEVACDESVPVDLRAVAARLAVVSCADDFTRTFYSLQALRSVSAPLVHVGAVEGLEESPYSHLGDLLFGVERDVGDQKTQPVYQRVELSFCAA
jgi:hypothetical protein